MIVHVLRKPVVGTVAQNALQHGCGALNIEGCRIVTSDNLNGGTYSGKMRKPLPGDERTGKSAGRFGVDGALSPEDYTQPTGRWPANLVHDGSDKVLETFPAEANADTGGASRFFQQVKVK
jgi:site-specific DNA-methyltransferase (adenine-specific)